MNIFFSRNKGSQAVCNINKALLGEEFTLYDTYQVIHLEILNSYKKNIS